MNGIQWIACQLMAFTWAGVTRRLNKQCPVWKSVCNEKIDRFYDGDQFDD